MMRIIIFYIFFVIILPVSAQDREEVQPRDFPKEEWQRATQGIDYSADVLKERPPRERTPRSGEAPLNLPSFGGNASPVLKILIIVGLVIVLFFLIRSLLGLNNPRNKKVKPALSVEELAQLEDNLHQADLDDFIRRALQQHDFALAVRLYYLAILKELSLKNVITWKKDKTNRDYLRDMNRTPLAVPFSEITLIFERIWYGNVELQEVDFQQLEPRFQTFIRQIASLSTPVNA